MLNTVPRLLPKPSFYAYLSEFKRGANKGIALLQQYPKGAFFLFILIDVALSLVLVPRIIPPSTLSEPLREVSNNNEAPRSPVLSLANVPTPKPLSLVPSWFIVPKLNIDTSVEQVGQTKTLEMDVPKVAANVAWYLYGPKPGEDGNVVIAGHYDTPSGRPAVFYSLNTLTIGDEIKIVSVDGVETVYAVTEKKLYPVKEFPDEYVFHTRPGKNLNIITCAGIWNESAHIYNERLVVYATLKG